MIISTSLQSVHVDLAPQSTDYVFVLDCAEREQITIRGDYYPNNYGQIESIQIYAGDASEPAGLKAINEEGDATYRLITGITPDKFYTVKNLTAGGTFFFRVKAHYTDDTWSPWSKAKTVVLHGEITSVADVKVEHEVAGVEYVNLAGQRSAKPWQGVNIVVTRYTDGTTRSTKAIM